MKYEWRKRERSLYLPKCQPTLVEVPDFQFIAISGEGNPNHADFAKRVEALYLVAYGIRMSHKAGFAPANYSEFTVYPLEGVWDLSEEGKRTYNGVLDKDALIYQLMIRQPDFVDGTLFNEAQTRSFKKTSNPLLKEVDFRTIEEGNCVQLLHLGSFDNEPESFEKISVFCEQKGLKRRSLTHREIYLSDPRKTSEEKLKTVLRVQV